MLGKHLTPLTCTLITGSQQKTNALTHAWRHLNPAEQPATLEADFQKRRRPAGQRGRAPDLRELELSLVYHSLTGRALGHNACKSGQDWKGGQCPDCPCLLLPCPQTPSLSAWTAPGFFPVSVQKSPPWSCVDLLGNSNSTLFPFPLTLACCFFGTWVQSCPSLARAPVPTSEPV